MLYFLELDYIYKKKREIRTRYLSHVPGLRTCLPVKISNSEAHADMNIVLLIDWMALCGSTMHQIRRCVYTHPEDIYRCIITYRGSKCSKFGT